LFQTDSFGHVIPNMYLRVIACEVLFREICYLAASSRHTIDLDFLTQGLHDTPAAGRLEIQRRLDALPAGKYDAVLLGYGLCSKILAGLRAANTKLVVPRAHDCITLFLGSRERYQKHFNNRPGTYYFTSGWLECRRRRSDIARSGYAGFLPAPSTPAHDRLYAEWVEKYGADQAEYLSKTMAQWAQNYTHGVLIDFDFTRHLDLRKEVQAICAERGWEYEETDGDLDLIKRWLNGDWPESEFLIVPPGRVITPAFDESVIGLEP